MQLSKNRENFQDIVYEIENDIQRLEKIKEHGILKKKKKW